MTKYATETHNSAATGLDMQTPAEILSLLHQGQILAVNSVTPAFPAIELAAKLLADTVSQGAKLIYAAAGSSALMALADGLELPGTFGISRGRIKIIMAGGPESLADMAGAPEDDAGQAAVDITSAGAGQNDCLICLSASGTTPYALGAAAAAREAGARVIAITNNPDTALLKAADIAIYLPTPPEIISGSTRLGAATAQKITLNMISTLMAIHLGHVYDGYMVNLFADNAKLKKRARRMVAAISGCRKEAAQTFLEMANGSVKIAILLAAGAKNSTAAKQLLESRGQKLRPSLSILGKEPRLHIAKRLNRANQGV